VIDDAIAVALGDQLTVTHRDFGDKHLDLVFGAAAESDGVPLEFVGDGLFPGKGDDEREGSFRHA
jgi:hypothetical protein